MNQNKRGRPKLPEGTKAVTTSIRLRPDRLAKYKELGGVGYLNALLDREITIDKMFYDVDLMQQLSEIKD